MPDTTYQPKVYKTTGGDALKVASGGHIDVESGGELRIAGTALTGTAAELNKAAGVTAGTVTASKAVVVGANKEIDTIVVADSGLKLGSGAGTAVDATAAEINAVADLSAFAVAVTANADGLTTAIIAERGVIQYVTVTSGNSAHLVTLPAPTPGRIVILNVVANGFKIRSSAPATVAINGGTGASAASTVAADSTCVMVCISATAWKGFYLDADSDVAKVAAAA